MTSDSSMTRQLLTLKRFLEGIEDFHAGQAEGDFAGCEAAAFDHGLVGVHQACACAELRGTPSDSERRTMLALPD
jgi:hypothetical protein